jgi:hypothetical protein
VQLSSASAAFNCIGYVGAHSEIPFNAAVCSLGDDSQKNPSIISPPKVGSYPPALPSPSPSLDEALASERFYLPARELCDYYIAKFLADVHCTYWFYSIEPFLDRVENTYSESATSITSSWMCSLYSIFAISAANHDNQDIQSPSVRFPEEEKTSEDYIALAKLLIPTVYDEADIDSIRGLAIMVSKFPTHSSMVDRYRALRWRTFARE